MSTTRSSWHSPLRTWLAWTILVLAAAAGGEAAAQLTFEFGLVHASTLTPLTEINLLPNQGNQTLAVLVNNAGTAASVNGMSLEVFIAHGGPANSIPPGPGPAGPVFTGSDLLTGTPFAGVGTPGTLAPIPQYMVLSVDSGSTEVTLQHGLNLVATLTVTTAGFANPESWSLDFGQELVPYLDRLSGGALEATALGAATLAIVPEPGRSALAAGLSLLAIALVCRFRQVALPR
jgi:hypothetical protein